MLKQLCSFNGIVLPNWISVPAKMQIYIWSSGRGDGKVISLSNYQHFSRNLFRGREKFPKRTRYIIGVGGGCRGGDRLEEGSETKLG